MAKRRRRETHQGTTTKTMAQIPWEHHPLRSTWARGFLYSSTILLE